MVSGNGMAEGKRSQKNLIVTVVESFLNYSVTKLVMIIQKYVCQGCGKEHERRVFADKSEGIAVVFTEEFFPQLWELKKDNSANLPLEEFCKELFELAVYNYHKNSRRIRIDKEDVIADGSVENSSPKT